MRNRQTMTIVIAGCLGSGCVVQMSGNLDGTEEGNETDGPGDGDPGDGDPGDGDPGDGDPGDGDPGSIDGDGCQESVDILLIVDNSGSMGVLQRRLAESVDSLLGPLDAIGIDWRLAVTTTDAGDTPWCPEDQTTPERGRFQFRACNEHPEDFAFAETNFEDVACNEICPYPPNKLYTLPSTTDDDPMPSSRPWIEHIGGGSNLPEDIDPATASLCLVPQGVNGCGFEQPLEAMHLALGRAMSPGNPESGFIRDDASLLVIIVSDEVDCSHAEDTIFDQQGDRTFWSDPTSAFPTSAVCWNAGTSCSGNPAAYDDCVAANLGTGGAPSSPDEAVLRPIDRYVDLLSEIEQQKRAVDPGADVGVLVLGGLGTDGALFYGEVGDTDPAYQDSFGIGPGCVGDDLGELGSIRALPPVRLREVGAALTSEPLASICADDYFQSFLGVYGRLVGTCL